MLVAALRTAGRAVATAGRVTMPSRRTLARVFGAIERRLPPARPVATDGGRDRRPRQERRTTYQKPWLVAHDAACERWDDPDHADCPDPAPRPSLELLVTSDGALLVSEAAADGIHDLEKVAGWIGDAGGEVDYRWHVPAIRVGENALVDLQAVATSDVPLAGFDGGEA